MSGSVIRAQRWQIDGEEQYLAVHPNAEIVSLYQTNSEETEDEENNIVKVAERKDFDNIQCLTYSNTNPGLTATGQMDGKCLLFDIRDNSVEPIIVKPVQSRSCNSVSLNENGMIALGYDRG